MLCKYNNPYFLKLKLVRDSFPAFYFDPTYALIFEVSLL